MSVAQSTNYVASIKGTTDRIAEGHRDDCAVYVRDLGGCDCGWKQAVTDMLDAAARFEKWLDAATENAVQKMQTNEHAEDRHDRETMVRVLNLVRIQYEGGRDG